jgi:hypothetical protein
MRTTASGEMGKGEKWRKYFSLVFFLDISPLFPFPLIFAVFYTF